VPHVVVAVDVAAPATRTWQTLVDWPAHGRWVPLTRVRVLTASPVGVGARFVGRTGVGPVAFDDPMEVTEWSPPTGGSPGHCTVVKSGRVVLGTARLDVTPRSDGGCRVTWTYDVDVAPVRLTRPFSRLVGLAAASGVRRALAAMAGEVVAAHAKGAGA
jgi:hypothetical protein